MNIQNNRIFKLLQIHYQKQIESIVKHIKVNSIEAEILQKFNSYTLHDLDHFIHVADNAAKIIGSNKLNEEELFCLLGACLCHDLGMANTDARQKFKVNEINEARKFHATLSKLYINDKMQDCIENEKMREVIGIISEGHGRWDWENSFFDDINGADGIIRIRYLVCVLSLADLLDLRNSRRNPKNFIDLENLFDGPFDNDISKVHWLKHYYSRQPDIINDNNVIKIKLKAEVGTLNLGSNNYHRRTPLVQELVQGEILKVINNKSFIEVSKNYFVIELAISNSEWPCYVQISEANKMEFPEKLVDVTLSSGFLCPRMIELNTFEQYIKVSPASFYSQSDLELSFSERPASLTPKWLESLKKRHEKGNVIDNWDVVLWSSESYIKDINNRFSLKSINNIEERFNAMLEGLELIRKGEFQKIYIEASDLILSTATATKYISKHAYKAAGVRLSKRKLNGGKIELLNKSQKDLYANLWNNTKQKLGLSINSDKFKRKITPLFAYNYSLLPIYKVSVELNKYKHDEKTKAEIDKNEIRLEKIRPLSEYNEVLFKDVQNINFEFADLNIKEIADLKLLDILSSDFPWVFKPNTISSIFNFNSKNIVLKTSNKVIGYILARCEDDICEVRKMAIHPFFRGRGLAEKLIMKLLDEVKVVKIMTLYVRSSNHQAISLYDKLGFEKKETKSNYYKTTGNTEEDKTAYYMVKNLNQKVQ